MIWDQKINIMFSLQMIIAAAVLFLISLYAKSAMLVLITFMLLLVTIIPYMYLKKVAENMQLLNPVQKVKLFKGEEHTINFTLENSGRLPVFNGKFQFYVGNNVWCNEIKLNGRTKTINQFSFQFNLVSRESAVFPIKVRGEKRGVARVSAVNLTARDILGVGTLELAYQPFFKTEVIVYPELLAVTGLNQLKKFELGFHPMQSSLFEDVTATVGTRDYVSGDSFNSIHWKASAKSSTLQTKQYEKTSGMAWTFMLHLSRTRSDVSNNSASLEKDISYLAYLCKYATTKRIPYDIFVNIKVHGKDFIMHLKVGEGRGQLSKALEMLARINFNSVTVPQKSMFAYVNRVMYRSSVIILLNCGKTEEEQRYFKSWEKKGSVLFEVEQKKDAAYIVRALPRRKAIS